jgi:hypothetical protein
MSKSQLLVRTAVLAALMACSVGQAQANTITIKTTASGPIVPAGSPDWITLNAGTHSFNVAPGVTTPVTFQTGYFDVSGSTLDGVTLPFSFVENVTINGNTEAVSFSGNVLVTYAQDTLTFNPGSAQSFAGGMVLFQPLSLSVPTNYIGDIPFSIQADIRSVPEPATLALIGLGLAGVGLLRRRKTI